MNTKQKSNSILTSRVLDDGTIEITVLGAGVIRFDPSRAHESLRDRAESHGWIQRLSDGAAMSRNTETGLPATPAEKFEAIRRIAEHYMSGASEWALRATGGGDGETSLIVRAVAQVQRTDTATIRARAEAAAEKRSVKVGAVLRQWAQMPDVKRAIEALREAQAPAFDADEALREMSGEE